MTNSFLQMDGGADFLPFLIYLIIFVVWMVGRTLQLVRRGQRPGQGMPPDEEQAESGPDIDEALRDFLETVTGTRTAESRRGAPPAPSSPPPVRKPAAPPRSQPPPVAAPQRPPVAAPQRPPRPAAKESRPPRPARPAAPPPKSAAGREIAETEIGAAKEIRSRVSLGSLTRLAGYDALRIPMTSIRLPPAYSQRNARNRLDITDPDASRRAMIERIVLGPPRALDPSLEDLQA